MRQIRVVSPDLNTQSFDNKLMIRALRQTGDGHAADDAGSGNGNRKRSSVRCIARRRQSIFVKEGFVFCSQGQPDSVGTAMKPRYNVAFFASPLVIVR